jgi:hypothetical protein
MAVEGHVAAVVVKEVASHGDALREAGIIKNCPFLLMVGVNDSTLTTVFMVPEEYRWWADYSELFPESKAQTFLVEEVLYPISPREVIHSDSPPCGADCDECPQRDQFNCKGCVATRKE